MTASRAPANPYTTRFEAVVRAVDGPEVVLDETYFYPEGGGQPADRGRLAGHPVEHVHETDGEVVHVLADDSHDVEPDATVEGHVDFEFRRYCMRAHTASHALYGAGRRLLADLGYGGFDIGEEKVRVDFETTTEIDDDTLVELERLTNRAVWESHEVTWEEIPQEEAMSRHDVAFNVATEEGVMAESETVRVVEIDGWDAAACGGTHVENTKEIGPVAVLDRSNPGEGLTRVEFAVGEPAIERRADERKATLSAAETLGVPVSDLDGGASEVRAKVDALEGEVASLRDRLFDAEVANAATVAGEGGEWLVTDVEGFDASDVGDRVRAVAGERADVVALTGGEGRAFLVVATAEGVDVGAGDVVDAVTEEFGGGGGGGSSFAQGGGLDATPADVTDFVRSRWLAEEAD
ncbi:alanyl-tRNA editing protein [Halospeciosus flavus]|uniref:Alanyl-tRNA editing protein n=1 Tax=Halospeciosus flavus TaxID=3032283 RepID=A0ABD5Z1I6_9EURY|nr:alanyl-tRNA editing protein [Halospeciosus flavus]